MVIPARPARPRTARRTVIVVSLLVAFVLASGWARFYTDVLWFGEVGFTSVLWTSLLSQFGVGVAAFLIAGGVVFVNLYLARRVAPPYRRMGPVGPGGDVVEQYRDVFGRFGRWIDIGLAAALGLAVAGAAGSSWQTVLLWINRVGFGRTDPQFGRDVGFYVFELPFYGLLLDLAWFMVFATLLLVAGAHFLHGSIRPEARLAGILPAAMAHVSVLLGLLALIKAGQYWLGTYELNFSTRGTVTGASYTDVHAQLPALRLLAIISVISALLFLVNIRVRRLSLPLAAVAIWMLTAVLAGGVWPWWVQRFSVAPQEPQREREFIARNIAGTRAGFGLEDVATDQFEAAADLSAGDAETNEVLLQNVRLWDPDVLQTAYTQLQAIRTYYEFSDVDIDRYEVGGDTRQVLLSSRELDLEALPERSATWSNIHLQYTHGFGVVASLANEATPAGQPRFLVQDVPGRVESGAASLELEQPRIYYGEAFDSSQYSVVDTGQAELDFPVEGGAERTRYDGEGGIPIGNIFKKLTFAIREGDPNLVLSNLIRPESRMLIYRNVRDRVLRVAPFLALDHDAYIAAVDGRLVWIIDAYTSSRNFPYSQRFQLSEIVGAEERGALEGSRNYIRNSVKVTVDAYDGTMNFYIVDDEDPLVRAWAKTFPDLFTQAEPSDALRAHFRYPEDLFKVQSEVFLTYHMTDPLDFYSKEDEWDIANVTSATTGTAQTAAVPAPATYLLIRLPGEDEQEFVLTRPFTPHNKNNMIAVLAARSDPENYGEITTLQFPRQRVVPGPSQVSNLINQDVQISQLLTLLGKEGSKVQFGSLVILPIEESLLYIQPMFVIAESVGIPELKKVVLVMGEQVFIADTFDQALAALLGVQPPEAPGPEVPPEEDVVGPEQPEDLQEIVREAAELYDRAQQALAEGDFATYGRLIQELGELLEEARADAG